MKLIYSITRVVLLLIFLILCGCGRFFGKGKMDPSRIETVEKLHLAYQSGDVKSLDLLIDIYLDATKPLETRLAAGEALAATHHPSALEAISHIVSSADGLDLTFMEESIEILAGFKDDPQAAEAMVSALHNIEGKTNSLHLSLVKSLGKVRTKDQILHLLDIYEVSKANLAQTENMLTRTLGQLGDDQVIPVLTAIAKDESVSLPVRNRAVEILGKKETADVVGSFTELLGNPATSEEVRDFALNTMAGVKEENLILALLDTYNSGKNQYYSLLNTILDALGEFDDPEIKSAVMEIIMNQEYPASLRRKALKGLIKFNDPELLPPVIELLKERRNYYFYDTIMEVVKHYDQDGSQQEKLRRIAFETHQGGKK